MRWGYRYFVSLTTANSFIFYLAYTTRTNQILWLNLNCKILLKCVDTTNFLCKNLTYKRVKNFPIPPLIWFHQCNFGLKLLKLLNISTLLIFYATSASSKNICR